jgi:hypothetical protein
MRPKEVCCKSFIMTFTASPRTPVPVKVVVLPLTVSNVTATVAEVPRISVIVYVVTAPEVLFEV